MLTTTDGRKIRARKDTTFVLVEYTRSGEYAVLDRITDGIRYAGPTVTAAEWHRHQGNVWVRCSGSNRTPRTVAPNPNGFYYSGGTCAECGAGAHLRHDGTTFLHRRPAGQHFENGTQVANITNPGQES